MRVRAHRPIDAPQSAIWSVVSDPQATPHYLSSITHWKHAGGERSGVGASYETRIRVGAIELSGAIEFWEWWEPHALAWRSTDGIEHHGRIFLEQRSDGRTETSIEISFEVPGPVGPLAAFAASFVLRRQLDEALRRIARMTAERDAGTEGRRAS